MRPRRALWRAPLLLAGIAVALLAGCESTPTMVFTYGTQGTIIQAERLVAEVYGTPADPLPYGGPDIDRPLARMKARWARLKPLLDEGVVGLTEFGEVALRDAGSRAKDEARDIRHLVRAENRDREELYRGMTAAIGHGGDNLQAMIPYTEDRFGAEWAAQAPAGWWLRDYQGRWGQKQASARTVDKPQ